MPNPEIKLRIKQIIEDALKRLRALNADAESHPRDAKKGRVYNREIMRTANKFSTSNRVREYMHQLGGDQSHTNPEDFVGPLMRKSSKRDRRLLSRYRATTKLALSEGVECKHFRKFLEVNGGYKGCAAKYFKAKAKAASAPVH